MEKYPRTLTAAEISPQLATLVYDLAARMLGGAAPEHTMLRAQLTAATLASIELTGVGLFAHFVHPPVARKVAPGRMIGGNVPLEVRGLASGAGSLVAVSDGLLSFIEIYTFGNDRWPDKLEILRFGEPTLLQIPASAT